MGQPALQNEIFLEADLLQEMIEDQARSQEINEHGADWIINGCNIPTELKSFLDDQGRPIKEQENSLRRVTCPKVPPMLRNRSQENFDPKILSFGPYHHGKPELQEGETLKSKFMLKLIEKSGKSFQEFYSKVREMNYDNRACYVDGSTNDYDDNKFALMMLRDGCFILYIMDISANRIGMILEVFKNHMDIVPYVFPDMILLENQIPFAVLELLMSLYNNENLGPGVTKRFIYLFIWGIFKMAVTGDENEEEASVHLLDRIHKELSKGDSIEIEKSRHCFNFCNHCFYFCKICFNFCKIWSTQKEEPEDVETVELSVVSDQNEKSCHCFNFCKIWSIQKEKPEDVEMADFIPSFRSVRELKTKGIHFKPINSSFFRLAKYGKSISLRDVEFKSGFLFGELKLPPLFLGPSKIKLYSNLAAFEWCHPSPTVNDFVVTSYISFLNTLIDGPDDVRELRSKRILLDNVDSDEEVVNMLRKISINQRQTVIFYHGVRKDIEKHYNSKIRTWVAEIIYKYFSSPWTALGLFAALAVLVLTVVQTFFTIHPVKEK